ncbi:P-loop containing nucleoside triphosphate hydrolase protein [Mollisia scopiformis]|uniref:p-loop containing nucleoside triphosphate hydrolase protein n=1 Tax=Mollisia scopiformis TaxID=149040 RepID=A0A194XNJ9_MOLSC|nr:P-loop containing nucleoside triphosphate hydrolase protein [Mollisia scopiformis]KUJ21684.1 P-loop containing nucleoside triphosphate hydrolase protein [Mollisia scopiformis]
MPTAVAKDGVARRSRKPNTPKTTDPVPEPSSSFSAVGNRKASEHGELLDVDPNNGRRKRRKTTPIEQKKGNAKNAEAVVQPANSTKSFGAVSVESGLNTTGSLGAGSYLDTAIQAADALAEPNQVLPKEDLHVLEESSTTSKTDDSKPRKVLRFNPKTGTIGSPPAKKPQAPSAETKKTAGGRGKKPKSRIVTIRYGPGQLLPSTIGQKIDLISNGTKPILPAKTEIPIKLPERTPPKPVKPHPFFSGKVQTKPESPQKPDKHNATVVDLTQPKECVPLPRTRPSSCSTPLSLAKAPTPFSGLGSSSKITKFPGAVEPAWPGKGMVHVRGLDPDSTASKELLSSTPSLISTGKKSKYQAIRILEGEDILANLATDLTISNVLQSLRDIDPTEFPPVPDCLRLPVKHLEPGFAVQKRIRKQLRTRFPAPRAVAQSSSEDEIQLNNDTRPRIHPALLKTYELVSTSLSAFDKGHCETQPWTNKYSPKLACDVLQSGRDVSILKDWLQSLTVKAVEAGLGNGASSSRRPALKLESGTKRKRKSKKLDGFVVSSGEEADDMDEISEQEDVILTSGQGPQRRTIVRTGDLNRDSGRSTNAIVISGPQGCGKTAAVYAVAKELGFEVFELNPGSKRTGKDILDKVGDMARNHQVQRLPGLAQVDGAADEDRRRVDEALANDLKSGRQGTMNCFFKTQPSLKPETKAHSTAPAPKTSTQEVQTKLDGAKPKAAAKTQRQSLILIEEADILYKEDTQFWPTILELITTSKRPIVLTCNDESALPMETLPLHAIIRMNPPPVDLAVDYMLLVAACEGHVLERESVQTLYESRNMDLRASLTDLDFWCQFAIGDQKNGLNWYISRWPKGTDIDEDGNMIRVVSEKTYQVGMGWLSQDVLESQMYHLDREEEALHEACDGWDLDVGNWQESLNMGSWAKNMQEQSSNIVQSRASLRAYDEFLEALSSSDLCSGGLFASENQLVIDPSVPEITTKAREDYTLASKLLDAPAIINYTTLSKDISLWMKSRSRNYLYLEQHVKMALEVPVELSRPDEAQIIQLIRRQASTSDPSLHRRDFSATFDPISEPEKTTLYGPGQLEASVFDRTMNIIAQDMAPYVRSIVYFDARLQAERAKLSNLLSEGGGRKGKRMRTTRAAMSALEGGARSTTRREKYFGSLLNPHLVMKTGMQSWMDAALMEMSASASRRSSKGSLDISKMESDKDELLDDQ